jgi:glutaredoxin
MKKSSVVVLVIVVAVLSSAATLGVQKLVDVMNAPGGDIIIITDKRCEECKTDRLETSIKRTFPEAVIEVIDYSERKAKKLYDAEKVVNLPAVLLPKSYENAEGFAKVKRFTKPGDEYFSLRTGAKFDPKAEICDNEVDDNGDGLIDCKDPTCKTNWKCMEKREKPDVDVFVMSHCPYGTQIEKGLLPVWDALGDKINLNIRYVDYAMHGKKEIDEQLKQYCVAQQGKGMLKKYLECFLKDGKPDNACTKQAKVNEGKLSSCIKKADKEFGITADFKDKKKWKGRFPPFGIHKDLAQKYGVRGSPTLVVNDVVVRSGRSPKAIQDAICKAFKTPPPECKKPLSKDNPAPGFGFKKGSKANNSAKCGT